MSRAWRPAVLLRLGYGARNGGEELASWMWREGPRHWFSAKAAKGSLNKHVVWDEYGRKIFKQIKPEEQTALVWRPFSRVWRSFNEIAGIGDYAITRKALVQSIKENPNWKFYTDAQREAAFNVTRDALLTQADAGLSGFARASFDIAEAGAQKFSAMLHYSAKGLGIPTKQNIAKWIGKSIDPEYDARVRMARISMTNPTIMDHHMRDILGTFDTYVAADKVNMDTLLRQGGFGTGQNIHLPINYGQTELKRLSNISGNELNTDKSLGVAQQLSYYADDPSHVAALGEISLYASPIQEATFAELNKALGLISNEGTHSAVAYKWFNENFPNELNDLGVAFDIAPVNSLKTVEDVDGFVSKTTAIDQFIEAMPEDVAPIIRKWLEPTTGTGQSPNPVAFLLNDSIDATKITTDWTIARERAKQAFANALMTPEGQQLLYSTHRSNMGFDKLGGVISSPLPPGYTRLFVPLMSTDQATALSGVLSAGDLGASLWFDEFVRKLESEFVSLGIPAEEATKTVRMLQPSMHPETMHHTPNSYLALAQSYVAHENNWMPLLTVSSNDQVAHAISKVMDDMLNPLIPVDATRSSIRGRIGSIDVNSEELFNEAGAAVKGRERLNVPSFSYTHGGVTHESIHANLGYPGNIDLQNQFYGWGQIGENNYGAIPAVDFGARGLRDETVIGAPLHMLLSKHDNVRPVQMIDNTPVTHKVKIYRHKEDGRTAVFRNSDDVNRYEWYNEAEWEVIDEQIVTNNDLRNAADELALINIVEIEDMITSGSRTLPGQSVEVFHPWIREVDKASKGGEISQVRLNDNAVRASWWDKAPKSVLTLLPVTDQVSSKGEVISKAWNTLLRNWFDGVVNPAIGAMVREPLFQHYLIKGFSQTAGVRKIYHHKAGRYDNLAVRLDKLGSFDDEGQFTIEGLKDFFEIEWAGATMDPQEPLSKVFFAIENGNINQFKNNLTDVLKTADMPPATKTALKRLKEIAGFKDKTAIEEFFDFSLRYKRMFDSHRDVALQRALTLTGAFIDDHRIRSQFQEMVGTMIPFWFAEDQFLRRLGRSINHNPMMLRNLHLTMNAGVYGGLIQEDQFGEKRLVIPGSEVGTNYLMEIANNFPIVNRIAGGAIGAVARNTLSKGVSMNINIIPGYDLEQMGQMGFGPLAAIPINIAAHRDPSIRQHFEKHMVGGRYQQASALADNSPDQLALVAQTMWSSIVPAVIARPISMLGWDGGAGRTKATIDVIKVLAMNDMLPDERDIASLENPDLFNEQFMDRVNMMAMQYQALQSLSWFIGPVTASFAELTTHPNFEWNEEFHDLLEGGVPYEEAYNLWVKNIVAREGEFDPLVHSPFKTGTSTKIPFAVLESTQDANVWLTENEDFVRGFKSSAAFFMPRKFDSEDSEYVQEAKQRQINMGLSSLRTSEEFLTELYKNAAYHTYHTASVDYKSKKYAAKALGIDTTVMDLRWDAWYQSFQDQHPVLARSLQTSTARDRQKATIQEFRLLASNTSMVPDNPYKADILNTMVTIVEFNDKLESLSGRQGTTATDRRNALKLQYWNYLEREIKGKPWLNELYYSVFLPMLTDSWMAKYDAGLVEISPLALAV